MTTRDTIETYYASVNKGDWETWLTLGLTLLVCAVAVSAALFLITPWSNWAVSPSLPGVWPCKPSRLQDRPSAEVSGTE